VQASLKQQLLAAVDYCYLQVLEDVKFGFADVTPCEMMEYLHATYGQVTQEDIEANCNLLSSTWSPDDPITDIWLHICICQSYALAAGEPISNSAAIPLTLGIFKKPEFSALPSISGRTNLWLTKPCPISKLTLILKKKNPPQAHSTVRWLPWRPPHQCDSPFPSY
jgi:hypothetical protein